MQSFPWNLIEWEQDFQSSTRIVPKDIKIRSGQVVNHDISVYSFKMMDENHDISGYPFKMMDENHDISGNPFKMMDENHVILINPFLIALTNHAILVNPFLISLTNHDIFGCPFKMIVENHVILASCFLKKDMIPVNSSIKLLFTLLEERGEISFLILKS